MSDLGRPELLALGRTHNPRVVTSGAHPDVEAVDVGEAERHGGLREVQPALLPPQGRRSFRGDPHWSQVEWAICENGRVPWALIRKQFTDGLAPVAIPDRDRKLALVNVVHRARRQAP
jgi:hypothetical protein